MNMKLHWFLFLFLSLLVFAQAQPNTTGYSCSADLTTYPCPTYAFYRALSPDLASVADLFSVSRVMIARASNISSPSSPLVAGQPLFVPLSCGCNPTNSTPISYANLTYTIKSGDTFYLVSTRSFQNLTTYQSVMRVNPTFEPTLLEVGDLINFPIFCKCPNATHNLNFLVSYVFQPSDTISSVASFFGVPPQSLVDFNGDDIQPFHTVFVPVTRLKQLPAADAPGPDTASPVVETERERKGVVTGLGVGLGIVGFLLVLVIGMWAWREASLKRRGVMAVTTRGEEKRKLGGQEDLEGNLMADVSDCLDKYRIFKIDQLKRATDGFTDSFLIQGSVYKGSIDGHLYAIKKMKWNAYEELKILQKVNHGNLVKLEGFCIDPEDGNCYLIYEYLENGSLYSLLHENDKDKLSWKASYDPIRLRKSNLSS